MKTIIWFSRNCYHNRETKSIQMRSRMTTFINYQCEHHRLITQCQFNNTKIVKQDVEEHRFTLMKHNKTIIL
jgi:hypothetical protein